ncbi:hypothetical protein ACHAWF_018612 [Thalassiosira exigua]
MNMSDGTATQRRTTASTGDAAAPSSAASSSVASGATGSGVGGAGGSSTSTPAPPSATSTTTTTAIAAPLRLLSRLPAIVAILLRVLLWPAFRLLRLAFPPKEFDGVHNSVASDRAARAFAAAFRRHISAVRPGSGEGGGGTGDAAERYVEPPCPFGSRGYGATIAEVASRPPASRPLLLLYLHSPLHPGATQFEREYLCDSRLLTLLNENGPDGSGSVACFGASVHAADGQRLREAVGATGFPFLALLSVKGNSGGNDGNGGGTDIPLELLVRMEGPALLSISPAQITTYLTTAISRHAEILAAEEARRLQREEDQLLREEQNREYQEALLADQRREAERHEAEERERREREEAEEAERLREAVEASKLDDARATLEKAGGEPPAGSPGTARLRLTLPNGKRVDRRFRGTDEVGTIRAFLVVHFHEQGIEMKNFGLSTNYPRRTFEAGEDGLTLEEAGLAPQAVVMVQDLDS